MKGPTRAAVVLVIGLAASACARSHQAAEGLPTASLQALRTCVDRWDQDSMVGWGPAPVNVAFRRPVARERASIVLSRRRQCIVSIK